MMGGDRNDGIDNSHSREGRIRNVNHKHTWVSLRSEMRG